MDTQDSPLDIEILHVFTEDEIPLEMRCWQESEVTLSGFYTKKVF